MPAIQSKRDAVTAKRENSLGCWCGFPRYVVMDPNFVPCAREMNVCARLFEGARAFDAKNRLHTKMYFEAFGYICVGYEDQEVCEVLK